MRRAAFEKGFVGGLCGWGDFFRVEALEVTPDDEDFFRRMDFFSYLSSINRTSCPSN